MSNENTISKNKNFFLLIQGMFISVFGAQCYFVAESLIVKHHTESGVMVGITLALSAIPYLIFGTIGGAFADSHNRKSIIVWCDVVSALAVLSLAFAIFLDIDFLVVPSVILTGITLNIVMCFFNPASRAMMPMLVDKNQLLKANSLFRTLKNTSEILGQSCAGVLYALLGPAMLFFINGITYLSSAASESRIKVASPDNTKDEVESKQSLGAQIKEGFSIAAKVPGLLAVIIALGLMDLFLAPLMTFLPFFVENSLGLSTYWFGIMFAALSVGAVLGSFLSGLIKIADHIAPILIPAFLVGTGLSRLFMGLSGSPWLVFVCILMETATAVIFSIRAEVIIQSNVESKYHGRIFGLLGMVMGVFTPIGMALGGVLVDLAQDRLADYIAGSGIALTLIAVSFMFSRNYREFFKVKKDEASLAESVAL
ncbi:MFS transporter [Vibrio aquimaris]|uniref:Bacilysin exporter BacE n=1 Tax=Vibrio aquimaris TaxID=2587862 RepID=A0A5P9CNI5_9VIBR|nr:MFS transporter [Vibrio aquimaris]QFT27307.1 Putative bacilysin exporter BacE [Vibrio aquimaris]